MRQLAPCSLLAYRLNYCHIAYETFGAAVQTQKSFGCSGLVHGLFVNLLRLILWKSCGILDLTMWVQHRLTRQR